MTHFIRRNFLAQAGFTMIELLVVIAVIGVLSVAVLSSINPIEQINKGRDTRARSDAAQLLNAADRYFSIHEVYPWNVDNGSYTAADEDYESEFIFDAGGYNAEGGTAIDDWGWVDILGDTAEIKSGFVNRLKDDDGAGATKYFIYKGGESNDSVYVCFKPASFAFSQESKKSCEGSLSADFPADTACPNAVNCRTPGADVPQGANSCMVCLP
jgi:prepilin-type N-terminal cleavage/methylation domain-containing protein